MAKDNYGLLLTAIVSMVAVAGLVILFSGGKAEPVVVETPQQYMPAPAPAPMTFGQQYGTSGYTPTPYTQPAWQSCVCRDGSVGTVSINARCIC